jgi:hypothetical protein
MAKKLVTLEETLDEKDPLFTNLESNNKPGWWVSLVRDPEIYIDIRKGNYIDVYFNGGGLIKNLKHNGTRFEGEVHYKYLLTEEAKNHQKDGSSYIKYAISNNSISIKNPQVQLIKFNNFDKNVLDQIKSNIKIYQQDYGEKGIQAAFVTKTGCFIDSEFAYNYEKSRNRIDLVWIDKKRMKIQPVELKTIGNKQMHSKITMQLEKYRDFVEDHERLLLSYYKKLFIIKKKLNILPRDLQKLDSLDDYTMAVKPLLLLGDCNQEWIKNNASSINDRIKKIAIVSKHEF